MHHNIAAYQAAVKRHVTVVIPWHGQEEDLLRAAIRTLPKGIRLIVAKNAGKHEMATALNEALSMVTTKYVFLMGADDIIARDTLWRLWEAAIGYDGSYPRMIGFGAERFKFSAEPWCPLRIQDSNICGIVLIKTSVLRAVNGWRDEPIEDWDLMYRIGQAGYRLAPAPLARYGYRQKHHGLHRTTVREAQKLGLTWADVAPYKERVPVPAVFYLWRLDGTGYVRCELGARAAHGVCRLGFDKRDAHEAPAWVFQFPNKDAQEYWDLAAKMGKRRIIDVDDNYLSPELGAVVGAYHPENGVLWAERQESHRRMVEEADGIICATPALVEAYHDVNPNVTLCANSVDPADWKRATKKRKIVGVVLSRNHIGDAPLVENALRAASREPGWEVQVVGHDPDWDFAYTHISYTPSVASYRRVLSRWSVCLAPVIENDVTRCKSDLRWLEATMAGAALVCSDVEAYRVVPFGCAYKVDDKYAFDDATIALLRNHATRRLMLRDSMFHVKQNRLVSDDRLRSRYNAALGC